MISLLYAESFDLLLYKTTPQNDTYPLFYLFLYILLLHLSFLFFSQIHKHLKARKQSKETKQNKTKYRRQERKKLVGKTGFWSPNQLEWSNQWWWWTIRGQWCSWDRSTVNSSDLSPPEQSSFASLQRWMEPSWSNRLPFSTRILFAAYLSPANRFISPLNLTCNVTKNLWFHILHKNHVSQWKCKIITTTFSLPCNCNSSCFGCSCGSWLCKGSTVLTDGVASIGVWYVPSLLPTLSVELQVPLPIY